MGCPAGSWASRSSSPRGGPRASRRCGPGRPERRRRAGSFDDAPAPERPDAAADVVGGPARNASTMSWLEIARALFVEEGSTCLTGGGVVPYFNSCVGCSLTAAHQCVSDMRANVSFNVPVGCNMDSVGSLAGYRPNIKKIENRRCCPRLVNIDNEFTWAYRDALRCLTNIWHVDVRSDLLAECKKVCPTDNESIWEGAPSERSGARGRRPGPGALLLVLGVLWLR
ncbi:hypothetical protein JL720_2401 [Aureococcus anophagefferens]|nr:hypothetical protein JL720_2401 [Aureococcus anophagefferens]